MPKNNTPLEDDECKAFVQWLEREKLKFNHVKNENPIKNPGMFMKLKAMGVRSGFPDYVIVANESQTFCKRPLIFFIEMKRTKGSVTSPEQIEWIELLDTLRDTGCKICKGKDEAIEFISQYLK